MDDGDFPPYVRKLLRDEGIICIQKLQALVGVTTSYEEAADDWDHMTWPERMNCFKAWGMMVNEDPRVIFGKEFLDRDKEYARS